MAKEDLKAPILAENGPAKKIGFTVVQELGITIFCNGETSLRYGGANSMLQVPF